VVEGIWDLCGEEFGVVGDEVALEAGLDIFCKLRGAFDHE
jgi:hypothetical protein